MQLCSQESISFEEFEEARKMEIKPCLVFLHTDWCKYCEAMKTESFQDEIIRDMLAKDFYFISFNAETRSDVLFMGQEFKFVPNGNSTGYHELAMDLGAIEGKLNYPAIILLNEKLEVIYRKSSYHSKQEIITLLKSSPDEN